MSFAYAIAFVLQQEGGYVADLGDGAGPTNFGISHRSYPALDIQALTEAEAVAIYRRDFWDAIHLDLLPAPVGVGMLDAACNHGPGTAVRLLQQALGVAVDGQIGPVTASAAARPDALRRLCVARILRYAQHAQFSRFGAAWARRVLDGYAYALGVPR